MVDSIIVVSAKLGRQFFSDCAILTTAIDTSMPVRNITPIMFKLIGTMFQIWLGCHHRSRYIAWRGYQSERTYNV